MALKVGEEIILECWENDDGWEIKGSSAYPRAREDLRVGEKVAVLRVMRLAVAGIGLYDAEPAPPKCTLADDIKGAIDDICHTEIEVG